MTKTALGDRLTSRATLRALVVGFLVTAAIVVWLPRSHEPASAAAHGNDMAATLTATAKVPSTSPRRIVTGWLPFWRSTTSPATVRDHTKLFAMASPFDLRLAKGPTVVTDPGTDRATLQALVTKVQNKGVRALPTVATHLDATQFARMISTAAKRSSIAAHLVKSAKSYGADGVDLDLENVNFGPSVDKAKVRQKMPLLMAAAASALHRNGLLLSVTVPPRVSDSDANWSVYDYAALGAVNVDRFQVMTYDFSWSGGPAGPVAPKSWVHTVMSYAVSRLPHGRTSMGLPAYGYNWFVRTVKGTCSSAEHATVSGSTRDFQSLAKEHGVKATWDAATGERTFTYRKVYSDCTAKRVVWYEDRRSAKTKAPYIGEFRLRGVALWALGGESTGMMRVLSNYASTIAKGHATLSVSAPNSVRFGKSTTVSGTLTLAGQPISGGPVSLWAKRPDASSYTRVAMGTSDASGQVSFAESISRHTQWQLRSGGTWDYTSVRSPTVITRVRYAVDAAGSSPTAAAGTTWTLSGTVLPVLAGKTVVRKEYDGTQWVVVGSTTVDVTGAYSFTVKVKAPLVSGDVQRERVRTDASTWRDAGRSHVVTVTVS